MELWDFGNRILPLLFGSAEGQQPWDSCLLCSKGRMFTHWFSDEQNGDSFQLQDMVTKQKAQAQRRSKQDQRRTGMNNIFFLTMEKDEQYAFCPCAKNYLISLVAA